MSDVSHAESAVSDDSIKGRSRVDTVQSGHSKMSKSTVSSKKSRGVRESRLGKHLEHCKEMAKSKGEKFLVLPQEEFREQQRKKMIVILDGAAQEERPSAEIIASNMKTLSEQKFTLEERVHFARSIDEHFRPKYSPKPKDRESFERAHYNALAARGPGEWFCRLCKKAVFSGPHDSHTTSALHRQRCEEQAACDEMCGVAESVRRFEEGCGYTGVLTEDWDGFKRFWGCNVTNMTEIVWSRLRSGNKLEVDMPHWGKKSKIQLGIDRIRTVEMAAVTYPGQGKYDASRDCLVPYGKFERLIEDDGFYKAGSDGSSKGWSSPPGRGWWPVCMITWDTQHVDHGYSSAEVYFRDMVSGRVMCYVLCWYQLFDGTFVLSVWAVRFVSRL
jgi:hypothetical protein